MLLILPDELINEIFRFFSPNTSKKLMNCSKKFKDHIILKKKYNNYKLSIYSIVVKRWRLTILENIAAKLVQDAVQAALENIGLLL